MKERPMLFNGEMVRAILSGRKTQTRRPMKIQPPENWGGESERAAMAAHCPHGVPGDRIWVRETWYEDRIPQLPESEHGTLHYKANGYTNHVIVDSFNGHWRPSIHMPRWACRIVLEITEVRVQRVQDISCADAIAEGIQDLSTADSSLFGIPGVVSAQHPVRAFSMLWDSCYGKTDFAWDKNPWVWALTFRRVEGETK